MGFTEIQGKKDGRIVKTYNVHCEYRLVGNDSCAVKVVGTWVEADVALGDLGAGKLVEAVESEDLDKGNVVPLGKPCRLNLSVAADGNADSIILVEYSVELFESGLVHDRYGLRDVHVLVRIGVGLREVDRDKRSVVGKVFEVHHAGEASNGSLYGAIGGNGGVDFEQVRIGLGFQDAHALDLERGSVDLALGNTRNRDVDAAKKSVVLASRMISRSTDNSKQRGNSRQQYS